MAYSGFPGVEYYLTQRCSVDVVSFLRSFPPFFSCGTPRITSAEDGEIKQTATETSSDFFFAAGRKGIPRRKTLVRRAPSHTRVPLLRDKHDRVRECSDHLSPPRGIRPSTIVWKSIIFLRDPPSLGFRPRLRYCTTWHTLRDQQTLKLIFLECLSAKECRFNSQGSENTRAALCAILRSPARRTAGPGQFRPLSNSIPHLCRDYI